MRITSYGLELKGRRPELTAVSETDCPGPDALSSPKRIAELAYSAFRLDRKAEEHFILIAMDTKCVPLGLFEVSHGTVNASIVSPREIFTRLLLCGAVRFAVSHNHPSGCTEPSRDDNGTTEKLAEAGRLMNIPLTDHVIVGTDGKYYSYMEHGRL